MTVGRMGKIFNKALNKKAIMNEEGINIVELNKEIVLKKNKIKYKQNGDIEANMVGNVLVHFLANIDQFIKADKENKQKMLLESAIPLLSLAGKKLLGQFQFLKMQF